VIDHQRLLKKRKRGGGRVRGDSVLAASDGDGWGAGFDEILGDAATPEVLAIAVEEYQRLMRVLDDDRLRTIAQCKLEGHQNEEIADKEMVVDPDKNHVSLKVLLANKNVETKDKEKKPSTKDRVLSFRRRASKDVVSPVKPGSPKAGSGQQDWNSPARLPVEKKPKGRKQQWVPFICCSSVQ
jgi:hypothetical protein